MKHFIISIICLCISCFTCFGQQNLTNPISIGSILVDQSDVNKMIELCKQYKLIKISSDDDCIAYEHPDGSLIKFNILSDSPGYEKPYVEIHTTESNKAIEQTIFGAGFHKEKDIYVKGYKAANRFTSCHIIGKKRKRVIFTKEKGEIDSY